MLDYKYKAVNLYGHRIQGYWRGATHQDFLQFIKEHRVFLLHYRKRCKIFPNCWALYKQEKDQIFIFHQLTQLTKAGIMLIDSLQIIADTVSKASLKGVFLEMIASIKKGETLGQSLQKHALFDRFIICMIQQADKTGAYDQAFQDALTYLEWKHDTVHKMNTSLRYPLIIFIILIIMIGCLFCTLIPESKKFFTLLNVAEENQPFIFWLSDNLHKAFFTFLGAIVLMMGGFHYAKKFFVRSFPKLRYGLLYSHIFLSRDLSLIFRNLALLTAHGIPLLHALQETSFGIKSVPLKADLSKIIEQVESGVTLSQALNRLSGLDTLVIFMIKTGEKSGHLKESFEFIARKLHQTHESHVKNLIKSIEPIGLCIVACIILSIFWTVFLPLYEHAAMMEL